MWQPHDDWIYPHRSHPWHPLDWTQNALCNPGNRTASKDTTHQGSVCFLHACDWKTLYICPTLTKGTLFLSSCTARLVLETLGQQKMNLHHEKNIFKIILILWRRKWLFLSHHQANLWSCPGRFQNKRPVIKGWLLIFFFFFYLKSGFVLWN